MMTFTTAAIAVTCLVYAVLQVEMWTVQRESFALRLAVGQLLLLDALRLAGLL